MTRARALVMAIMFGCICIAVIARIADAQYSPAGGNTFGGMTGLSGGASASGPGVAATTLNLGDGASLDGQLPSGFQQAQTMGQCVSGTTAAAGPLNVGDAGCFSGTIPGSVMSAASLASAGNGGVSGTLPTSSGGTGINLTCGTPTSTCGPCQIPGMSYWNADIGVVTGDSGATFTWTDICNSYVVTNAINAGQPAYTSSCLGTHHCLTVTRGTLQQLQDNTFPAVAQPMVWGAFVQTVSGTPAANASFVDFGEAGAKVALYQNSSGNAQCYSGAALTVPSAGYINTQPGLILCTEINQSIYDMGISAMSGGSVAVTLGSGGTNTPTGGLAIGGQFGSDAGSANGKIFAVYVVTHDLTQLERIALQSYESTYWGGI